MDDLKLELDTVRAWFDDPEAASAAGVLVVRVSEEASATWQADLVDAVRRCYTSDETLVLLSAADSVTQADV